MKKDFFVGFNRLITPQIITVLYALTLILSLIGALFNLSQGKVSEAIVLIIIAVFSRVFFECVIVSFKNNEYLKRIAEALEKRPL
ncbi:hypothetical protein A7K99_07755 [Tatumella citrea]|uniref:DUF4282 domain-containing protein n=1 Tax=Tatumella citrea TaxID=53336 RepID=A0A1Y0LJ92_TATCI|nr:hypothetical protein A7K98_07755 [Tatumella citrea]ARU97719.1 hypothetical protein A7K99_07755 [Tatumella citrea]